MRQLAPAADMLNGFTMGVGVLKHQGPETFILWTFSLVYQLDQKYGVLR